MVIKALSLDRLGELLVQALPAAVLVLGLSVTYALDAGQRRLSFDALNREFIVRARDSVDRIVERLNDYGYLLRGAAGLFASFGSVDRKAWRHYVDSLSVWEDASGIQGVGYSRLVEFKEKAAHIDGVRREGFSDYAVRPDGDRAFYTPVTYLEPFSGRNLRAFGYDMFSEPVRREAMSRARDEGRLAMSGKVRLVQEIEIDIQSGFLVYVPVYRNGAPHGTLAERKENITGWVYAPFRMRDFIRSIIGSGIMLNGRRLALSVFDGDEITADSAMFHTDNDQESAKIEAKPPLLAFRQTITFGGHAWTVVVHTSPGFESRYPDDKAGMTAAFGGTVSLLLSVIAWFAVSGGGARYRKPGDAAAPVSQPIDRREWLAPTMPYLLATAMSLSAGFVAVKFDESERHARRQAERAAADAELNTLRLRLERLLTVPMVRTRGMEAQIIAHDGISRAEFDKVAEVLLRGHSAIRNISVSQDTKITNIYPIAGNEGVIGVDFRNLAARWPAVNRAILARAPVVQGPTPLVQGGVGLIILDPVFLPDAVGGQNRFFGVISIVLDVPSLFAESGLGRADLPITVAIRGRDGLGKAGEMVKGDPAVFDGDPVEMDVEFPYGSWRMAAIPKGGWTGNDSSLAVSRLLGGSFLLFVALVSFGAARHTVERRRLLREVNLSKDRFGKLLRIASDGVHLLDEDGRLVLWSNSFLHMLGYTEDEARTLNVTDWDAAIPPNELPARIREQIKTPVVFETRHRRRDGTVIDVEINACGIELDDRLFLYASSRDITDRKQYEAIAHRQTEIIRQSPSAIVVTDIQGAVTGWNAGAERLYGYPEAEVLGQGVDFLLPEADRSSHWERIISPLLQSGQITVEVTSQRKTGDIIIVDLALWLLRDAAGTPIAMVGYSFDISARKQAEAALIESRDRLNLALRAAEMGVWEWRIPTSELFWTPECMRLFDVDQSFGVIGDFIARIHPEDVERVISAARQAIAERSAFIAEFRIIHSDGHLRWIADHGRPDYDSAGAPIRMIGTAQDITVRKQYEDQLLQARRQADVANLAKSNFLAMMSHEIRTPITSVLGMADLLRRTPLNDEQICYVDTFGSSAKVLLSVLNDILDISKIEAGKVVIEKAPFPLHDTARNIVDLGQGMASSKGLILDLTITEDVPRVVVGDQTRVKQVLFNLINNAVKFTEHGSVAIRLSVTGQSGRVATILLEIKDTGIGMTLDQLEGLFTPFSQADQSTTRRFGGTGLGLAISKKLVDLMGGDISADSQPNTGTIFRVALPFEIGVGSAGSEVAAGHQAAATQHRHSLHILLAEDNRINQMLVRSMLQKSGHKIKVVDNGRQALDAVQAEDFDAVLMDMQMPVMDGEEATKAIRNLPPPYNRIPILALTADVMTEHRERYLLAGVDDLVSKPIDWEVLSSALETYARHP